MRRARRDFAPKLGSLSTPHPEYEQEVKAEDERQDQNAYCDDQGDAGAKESCDPDDRSREQHEDNHLDPCGQTRKRLEKIC